MSPLEAVAVAIAGLLAGGINVAVGSGTLVTFPVLLAVGYPPVVANVSNGLGLCPGSVSGAIGYRHELTGQRARLVRLAGACVLGGGTGAVLLLVLPRSVFEAVIPALIGIAVVLVVIQPWLARRLAAAQEERHPHGGVTLLVATFATGVYGGYFGAAQGVILVAVMGILMEESLQRLNAAKNVLVAVVNLTAGVVYATLAEPAWPAVGLLAAGSVIGGQLGARIGRKLPAVWLRGLIVVVGIAAIVQLVAG